MGKAINCISPSSIWAICQHRNIVHLQARGEEGYMPYWHFRDGYHVLQEEIPAETHVTCSWLIIQQTDRKQSLQEENWSLQDVGFWGKSCQKDSLWITFLECNVTKQEKT